MSSTGKSLYSSFRKSRSSSGRAETDSHFKRRRNRQRYLETARATETRKVSQRVVEKAPAHSQRIQSSNAIEYAERSWSECYPFRRTTTHLRRLNFIIGICSYHPLTLNVVGTFSDFDLRVRVNHRSGRDAGHGLHCLTDLPSYGTD